MSKTNVKSETQNTKQSSTIRTRSSAIVEQQQQQQQQQPIAPPTNNKSSIPTEDNLIPFGWVNIENHITLPYLIK